MDGKKQATEICIKAGNQMYITHQGECWDEAAKNIYGSEKYTGYLMQNNMPLLDTAVFSAGSELKTPALPEEKNDLPVWRRRN